MKTIKSFLSEDIFYRGYDAKYGIIGKKHIIWISPDEKLAKGYAGFDKKGVSTLAKLDYTPKKVFKAGRDKRHIKIIPLMMEMLDQSKKPVTDEMKLYADKLRNIFGNKEQQIIKYWLDEDEHFANLMRFFGFDAIELEEKNVKTLGVLKEHIKKIV